MKNLLVAALAIAMAAIALPTPTPVHAQAQTAPASPDKSINGKWHFVFDTGGGDRDFNAEFTVDADGNVTGTWEKAPATGTYKDGHLVMNFEITSEEVNETGPLHLDGKIDDSSVITGNWTFSSYDGTFKATHPKP